MRTLDASTMPIFCLNLDRATDRWAAMQVRAAEVGHMLIRFSASDHQQLTADDYPAAWLAHNPTATSSGNAACNLSHYRLWQHIATLPCEYAVVLEDDAYLLHPLTQLHVPESFDLFYLSSRVQSYPTGPAWIMDGCGTESYIVSQQAIPKLLQIFSDATVPVDLRLQAHMRGFRLRHHPLCAPPLPETPPAACYVSRQYPDVVLDAYGSSVPYTKHVDGGYSYINESTT